MLFFLLWVTWVDSFSAIKISGTFDVLAYTDMDVAVSFTWTESDAKLIANPQMLKLHSFDTKVTFTLNGYS